LDAIITKRWWLCGWAISRQAVYPALYSRLVEAQPIKLTHHGLVLMDRLEEALLAFIGNGEALQSPMLMSEQNEYDQRRVRSLVSENMVEIKEDNLLVSVKGWRFLDHRAAIGNRHLRLGVRTHIAAGSAEARRN
jgi:hypothetical protein